MTESKNVLTPVARLSFPYLFQPQDPMEPGGKSKYSATLLFEADADLDALRADAHRAVVERWGPDKAKWPKNMRNPFRDQGEKDFEGYTPGAVFIAARSDQAPGIVDQAVQKIIDQSEIYPGCYVRCTVRAFAYGGPGTKFTPGVAFGLQNVQKVRDGERLGNRTDPEQDFAPVERPDGEPVAEGAGGLFD